MRAEICNNHIKNQYLKAGRGDLTQNEMRNFAFSRLANIRRRVAENHSVHIPRDVVESLAGDAVVEVRVAVALHPSTPEDVKIRVAHSEDPEIRLGLAQEVGTPGYLLEHLVMDENPYVAHHASKTLQYKKDAGNRSAFSEEFARQFSGSFALPRLS